MRVADLRIALRARSAWEATDLGFALVRAQARGVWLAWLCVTLPAWLVVNLAAMALGMLESAPLVMWWLKPAFDFCVLFVISRAVFGDPPSLRATLAAQWRQAWRAVWPWLLWRRLHPSRALLLPIDVLEGVRGAQRSGRVSVLGRGDGATAMMLTLIAVNIETMLFFSLVGLALMFVPAEYFDDTAQAMLQVLFIKRPDWAIALTNFGLWVATSIVEPFYVGAGFGLYLNRRMQLEAWDVELAFRRIATRLAAGMAALVLALGMALSASPANASEQAPGAAPETATQAKADAEHMAWEWPSRTLPELMGPAWRDDDAEFVKAVGEAYRGEDLNRTRRVSTWVPRNRDEAEAARQPAWAQALGDGVAFVMQNALWIAVALLLALLAWHWRRWLPWLGERLPARRVDVAATVHELDAETSLPDDIVGAVRSLLASGRVRDALSLFYRAGVARLVEHDGRPLPPGATEDDCLRRARGLADARYAGLFARIVTAWQATAYAQRPPEATQIEALLLQWDAPVQAAP